MLSHLAALNVLIKSARGWPFHILMNVPTRERLIFSCVRNLVASCPDKLAIA